MVLADFDATSLPQAEEQVKALGAETLAVTMDVKSPEQWRELAELATAKLGPIAFFHNNAGGGSSSFNMNLWETPDDDWQHTLDLNLHGVLHGIREIVPRMLASATVDEPACVVNTASVGGLVNMSERGGAPYGLAKWGVTFLTETLASDLRRAKAPISAHVLCPMAVASNFGNNMVKTSDAKKDPKAGFQRMLERAGQTPDSMAQDLISKLIEAKDGEEGRANFYVSGLPCSHLSRSHDSCYAHWQTNPTTRSSGPTRTRASRRRWRRCNGA